MMQFTGFIRKTFATKNLAIRKVFDFSDSAPLTPFDPLRPHTEAPLVKAYYLDPLIKIKYQLADMSWPFCLVFTGSDMRLWLGDLLGVGHITGCM